MKASTAFKIGLGLAGLYLGWRIYSIMRDTGKGFADALNSLGSDIGTGTYNLTHQDENVVVQTAQQQIMADMRAAGSPQVGSDRYNSIMVDNGRTDGAVRNNLTTIWPPVPSSVLLGG